MHHYLEQELIDEMRRSSELFTFIRRAALDGLWYWDLDHPEVEWMDDRFWQTLGYDPATKPHLVSAWQDLIHPEDLKTALLNFEQHRKDPSHPYDQLVRYRHANGSTVWVRCRGLIVRDEQGVPRRMLGAHTELTDLQRTRAELQATNAVLSARVERSDAELHDAQRRLASATRDFEEARSDELRQLIEGLPLLVWTCAPDGACDYLSAQWIAYTGIPETEQLGSGWARQLHPEDLARTGEQWSRTVATGEPFDTEFRIRRHDGAYRWFATRASPLRDASGRIVKWVGSNTDIHDRKVLEQTLRERSAALEASNAELEQFAYVASHDLQEPLRTVTSYVQLIERRYASSLDAKGRDYVGHVVAGAKRMQVLIADLLAYSRATLAPSDAVVCNADVALDGALASLAELIRDSGADIVREPLGMVRIGEHALLRILQNLLSNAMHYRSAKAPPYIVVGALRSAATTTIYVRDNGIGIGAQHHKRIFQMFQRLQERSGVPGTGVGLALCRRLTESAGGEIWVESAPEAGSTFFVRLQCVELAP